MSYPLMIQAVADANLADARRRADQARRARQARASRHAPRRRTSHTVAAMSRAVTASSQAPSVS
jgi:hypothetical protein